MPIRLHSANFGGLKNRLSGIPVCGRFDLIYLHHHVVLLCYGRLCQSKVLTRCEFRRLFPGISEIYGR